MSRRDMKNCNIYREGSFKMENEPEEGEIVDEYDLIVSSDEEMSMRQRIRELEAENEEIEQIAVISRSYNDKINLSHTHLENSRAAQVPTDVSSISSTEFVTPKKRKRRKSREHKRKRCHHQHQHHHQYNYEHNRYDQELQQIPQKARSKKTHCKRRQKLFAKKHQKHHSDRYIYKDINVESISLDSPESSDSSTDSLTDTDNYSKNWLSLKRKDSEALDYGKYISRDTLRLAVARNTDERIFSSKKSCLKDKLLRQDLVGQSSNVALDEGFANDLHNHNNSNNNKNKNNNNNNNNDEEDEEDDDVQVIENEPDIQTVDEDSTDSMEEKELRLIALKSAVLKKHMARKIRNAEAAYSPTDFDEMLSSGILKQENKLDDIDVVDLEADDSQNACITASPEASPQLMMLDDQDESQQMVDCKPVDMDIANSDSEDTTAGSWSKELEPVIPSFSLTSHDFTNHFQYGFYMPDLHELPPPPPGVDDYEVVPPPPPYHKIYNAQMQDMELENEELIDNQRNFENTAPENYQLVSDNGQSLSANLSHKDDSENEDEEEEALRALLLSKFQSPKNPKKCKRAIEVNECKGTFYKNEFVEQSANNKPAKPTEFILKEAVKRLKIHTHKTELNKEEISEDFNRQNAYSLSVKQTENIDDNKGSLNVFEKLKNRLKTMKTKERYQESNKEESDLDENYQTAKQEQLENSNKKFSEDSNTQEYPTTLANTLDVTNKIDISAITRRLQKIKENVLNSTKKVIPPESTAKVVSQTSDCSIKLLANKEDESLYPLENIKDLNETLNSDDVFNSPCITNQSLTDEKTVEANFDVTTKQTTFKVTITNSAAIKPDENDTKDSNDVSSKENKTNNTTKTTQQTKFNVNGNTKNKISLSGERLVKIIGKTAETSSNDSKSTSVTTSSATNTTVSAPTYSLLRTTKIVKPNKVINANFDLNRRQVLVASETGSATKLTTKNDTTKQLPNEKFDNSRLITSIDQVKHMCKVAPFVINVQNSSNESSGDELGGDHDSVYKPLYDYNDNASPLSLNLESPSRTPIRSNSPTGSTVNGNTKNVDLNAKLDVFLKAAKTSDNSENVIKKNQKSCTSDEGGKVNKTPLAVRHLPAAAQSEYRRLVHRMKLLENKRKSAKVEENRKDCSTNSKKNETNLLETEIQSNEKDKCDSTNGTPKTSLVKKVLIRNANNNTTETENQSQTAATSKFHKTNVLKSYENLYVKFGAGIVNNLDKSLKLVEEAKKAKISKLKLEQRIKELKAEMDILQGKHKEEQQKISRIYPSICSTNEVITTLKQKRTKVFKAAINLGKTLKGEDYRLNNDLKESITNKSKQLALEIKLVNSLKVQDIAKIEETLKPDIATKEQLNCNNKINIEEAGAGKLKSNKDNIEENKPNVNTGTVGKVVEEEITKKHSAQSDDGGNTEFQNLESCNIKNANQVKNIDPTETETKLCNSEDKNDIKPSLPSYISPLDHLRNIDSNVDPNGVICPYDLMGNCEDVTCKYVHISTKAKS